MFFFVQTTRFRIVMGFVFQNISALNPVYAIEFMQLNAKTQMGISYCLEFLRRKFSTLLK